MTRPQFPTGKPSPVRSATITELFNEYDAYSLRVRNTAPETVKERRTYLDRAMVILSVGTSADRFFALTPRRLMSAVARYASDHGEGSRRWFQSALRSLLQFCYLRGYVDVDLRGWIPSFRRPRLASIPKVIPEDIIVRLQSSIDPGTLNGRRDAAIVAILATYGVRGFHVRKLQLPDLDWRAGRILFRACKRGKPIIQPLTAEVGNRLSDYIRLERPATAVSPEVFLANKPPYCPFTSSGSLSSLIARRFKDAQIQVPEGVSCGTHGFRHAFASRLCGKVPFKHISDMLGHRDYASVQVYAKVDFDDLAQAALPWPEEGVR